MGKTILAVVLPHFFAQGTMFGFHKISAEVNSLFAQIETRWVFLTLVTLAGITVLSLWPLDTLPSVPGTDKVHHLAAYTVLMFPAALRRPAYWRVLAIFFIAYGGFIELVQPYVNRHGEWLDMAVNTGGVICGSILGRFAKHFLKAGSENTR